MEWFILWLLFGVVTAVVAWSRGRSIPLWLGIGFVFGPFGLIASLVVPKDGGTLDQRAIDEGRMRKCPFCAEVIKREATKCRFCSSEIAAVTEEEQQKAIGVVRCSGCGKLIKPRTKDTTCYLCGHPLTASDRPTTT